MNIKISLEQLLCRYTKHQLLSSIRLSKVENDLLAKSQDPLAVDTEQRLLRFFDHQATLWAGYTLTGRPLHHYQAASVTAPIFAAVSAHKNEGYDALFVRSRSVVERPLPTNSYYGATLTTLVALWQ